MKSFCLVLLVCFLCGVNGQTKRTYIDFNFNKIFDTSVLAPAPSSLLTQTIEYEYQGTVLEGYLAVTQNGSVAARPGVLLFHDAAGINGFIRSKAQALAQLGYIVFAADVYGKGIRPSTRAQQVANSTLLKSNPPVFRGIIGAAATVLKNQPQTDNSRLGAVGYGFGGTAALEAARSGLPLSAVVSFYGDLNTVSRSGAGDIKGSVLILNGASDKSVGIETVISIQNELSSLGVDWQTVNYGNAGSAFSQPDANDVANGAVYNAVADARSDNDLKQFLRERFGA
eukprot:TRINITY_DN1491_c0_g1_i1.p1 TRINITY_DN1491_c0_g1~~TRINITY_DN1491_c0_g1_i1.p1  ORF type:complete len:317 (-),score=118.98 TRINITY_DN1491_c0_g1_i1:147-998(-)